MEEPCRQTGLHLQDEGHRMEGHSQPFGDVLLAQRPVFTPQLIFWAGTGSMEKQGSHQAKRLREREKKKRGKARNIPGGSLASIPAASREEERDKTKGVKEERAKGEEVGSSSAGMQPTRPGGLGVAPKSLPFYGRARRAAAQSLSY